MPTPYTLTTTTHIVSDSIQHPYDHHYITSDAWMHPTARPAKMNVNMPVTNDCRVWGEKKDWVFCGMMPWQDKPCEHSDEADFISAMVSKGYDFSGSNLIANFVKMQRIDDTNAAIHLKSEDTCKYETFDGLKVIRNDPASYSIASTHNAVVLVWGAWLVLFIVYAMDTRRFWCGDNGVLTYGNYNMAVIGVVILIFFLARFGMYGSSMSESGSLIMPNGSFVYVFFAVAWTLWSTRKDAADLNPAVSLTPPTQGEGAMIGFAAPMPEPIKVPGPPTQPGAPMAIDVSNFAGTKIKTRAYVQMGDSGRYGTQNSLTQVDVDLKAALKDQITADNYNNVEFESSRFYVAQLWVLPFSVLALFLFDTGFAMDMDLTLVFTLLFIFCLMDAFMAKLRNVNMVMESFGSDDPSAKKAMHYTLLLVQTVLFIVELSLIVITYNFMDVRMDVDRYKRITPVMLFFIVHSVNTTLMLFLMLVNIDTYNSVIDSIQTNAKMKVTWKYLVHGIRQINLYVFAFWVFVVVMEVNKAQNNLKIAENMDVFGDKCEGSMQTEPKCSMGTLWSNMYDPMSSAAYASS